MGGKNTKESLFNAVKGRFEKIVEINLNNSSFDRNLFVKNAVLFSQLEDFIANGTEHPLFMLSGGVGRGKTWNALGFMETLINKKVCLPFYISFKNNYFESLVDIFNLKTISIESIADFSFIDEILNVIKDMASTAGVPIFLIFDDLYNLSFHHRPAFFSFINKLTDQCGPGLRVMLINNIFDELFYNNNCVYRFNGFYNYNFGNRDQSRETGNNEKWRDLSSDLTVSRILDIFKNKIYVNRVSQDVLHVMGIKFPISAYLEGFSPAELNDTMKKYKIKEEEIPIELLDLLKIPITLKFISENGIPELPDNFIKFVNFFFNPTDPAHSLLHTLDLCNPSSYLYPVFSLFERCDNVINQAELIQYINSNKTLWVKLLSAGVINYEINQSNVNFQLSFAFFRIFLAYAEYEEDIRRLIFNNNIPMDLKNNNLKKIDKMDLISNYIHQKKELINQLEIKAMHCENNEDYDGAIRYYDEIIKNNFDIGNDDHIKDVFEKLYELDKKEKQQKTRNVRNTLVNFFHTAIPKYEFDAIKELEEILGKKVTIENMNYKKSNCFCRILNNHINHLHIEVGHECLPFSLGNLTNLEYLSINGKNINDFPDWIFDLKNLQILKITESKITEIPKKISQLKKLKKLYLSSNQIRTINEAIGNLENLELLDLSFNNIKNLPKSLGNLKNLVSLDLLSNPIQSIPDSFGNLSNLKDLIIEIGSKLETLPESFGNLKQLNKLYLSSNALTYLPESFGNLKQLNRLDLSCDALTYLPESFGFLENLRELELNSDSITFLPENFGNMTKLEKCNIYCKLSFLPESFKNLINLVELRLNNNNIKDILVLGECKNLRIIALNYNKLTELPESIYGLEHLKVLSLSSNKIAHIPEDIDKLKNLMYLNLVENPLKELPLSIAKLKHLVYFIANKKSKNYQKIVNEFKRSKTKLIKVKTAF